MAAFRAAKNNNQDYQEHPVASIVGSVIPSLLVAPVLYWFIGWLLRRKKFEQVAPSFADPTKSEDYCFYEQVADELKSQNLISGLWTRAFAEMGGDDAKARALYIKYRIQQLQDKAQTNAKQESGKPPMLKPPILKAEN